MRRFFLLAILIVSTLITMGVCFGLALAIVAPFHPGNVLFPLQHFAEEKQALLIFSDTNKALYYMDIADRRVRELAKLSGTDFELDALIALEDSLVQAETALGSVPESDAQIINIRLAQIVRHAEAALSKLTEVPVNNPQVFASLQAKLITLHSLLGEPKTALDRNIDKSNIVLMLPIILSNGDSGMDSIEVAIGIDPRSVAFLPGSAGAEHAFFPLVGQHASLDCTSCHVSGKFAETYNQCSSCHNDVKPSNHFNGECSSCHTSTSWQVINLDHSLVSNIECQNCHNKDKPGNHYSGQCSSCHSTNAWKPANFNHKSVGTDCQSCHDKNKPKEHFSGQCSTCHNTKAWKPASFNHSGQTNCQSCHSRPSNHASGQCSNCHSTSAWKPASFDHSGQTDCQSCHSRPSNHASGQCSNCHSTSGWKPANFNHSGQTDCQSCHSRPSNHYGGQCSSCHSTSAWKPASFNHSGQTDCQSCHSRPSNHYGGQCSSCHSTSAWKPASFNHSGQTDCQSCHSRPSNHWSGQCSKCHNTSSWGNIQVSGHGFPINHKNADGNCSKCHPSKSSAYTCYNCHDKAKMENKHAEKDIFDIANRCAECHRGGDD